MHTPHVTIAWLAFSLQPHKEGSKDLFPLYPFEAKTWMPRAVKHRLLPGSKWLTRA